MRPRLKPALRRITRDERTLQFGLHPRHAVVLTDLEPEVRRWVESLDGVRDLAEVLVGAADAGIGEDRGRTLLDLLVSRGVVDDAGAGPGPLRTLTMAERDRLQPDLDGLSLSPGTTDGGLATLERRRDAQVRVYGAGRVGAQIVALLAASGVGRICVVDPGTARNRDVVPGGLGWTEVGMSRQDGAVAVARSLAPGLTAWTGDGAAQLADGAQAARPGGARAGGAAGRPADQGASRLGDPASAGDRLRGLRVGRPAGVTRSKHMSAVPRFDPTRPRPRLADRQRPSGGLPRGRDRMWHSAVDAGRGGSGRSCTCSDRWQGGRCDQRHNGCHA